MPTLASIMRLVQVQATITPDANMKQLDPEPTSPNNPPGGDELTAGMGGGC